MEMLVEKGIVVGGAVGVVLVGKMLLSAI